MEICRYLLDELDLLPKGEIADIIALPPAEISLDEPYGFFFGVVDFVSTPSPDAFNSSRFFRASSAIGDFGSISIHF